MASLSSYRGKELLIGGGTTLLTQDLTEKDKKVLKREVSFVDKTIGDLFEVCSSKKTFNANSVTVYDKRKEGTYPYVVRSGANNGIKGYIKANENEINKGNTLSFAQDTFLVFYQKKAFVTGNNVKVLIPKFENFNEKIANYIITALNKTLKHLSWGTGSDFGKIMSFSMKLPSTDGTNVDFEYMEEYIGAIEKLVVNDEIERRNREVEEMKKIIN